MTVLRSIRQDELELVMHWRMLPEITRYLNTDPVLTLEKQEKWYASLKERTDTRVFMIESGGTPCGILQLTDIDRVNNRSFWGYYVAEKQKRSLKLALALECNLYDYAFTVLGLNKVMSETFTENKGVVRLHEMCGCTVEGKFRQYIKKNGVYYDVAIASILKEEWENIRDSLTYEKMEFLSEE